MNNYHTHSKYCVHGYEDIKEYVKEAKRLHMEELGFTCHIPLEKTFLESAYYKDIMLNANQYNERIQKGRESRMSYLDIDNYLNDLKEAKEENKDIKILSGFECEYDETNKEYVKEIRNKVDYLSLGLHHVFKDGKLYDYTKRVVVSKDTYRELNYDDFKVYAEAAINGMKSGLFKIFVHPEYFIDGIEEFNDLCVELTKKMVEASIENHVYLEINTSDYFKAARRNRKLNYPRNEFWKVVGMYKDAKVIIGTDAHKPERVGDFQFDSISKIIEEYHLNVSKKLEL